MQCRKNSPLGSDGIFLDASGKHDEIWCRAIAKNIDHGYRSYEMSVDVNNLKPVNFGHPGFVFNVQDDKNYDFAYIRYNKVIL